jgi:hypothetical protein
MAYHIAKAYDDFGDSVIAAVEKQIAQENQEEELISIWKRLLLRNPAEIYNK